MSDPKARSDRARLIAALFITGVLLLWGSFHPTGRVWGLAAWAYLDVWMRLLLLVVLFSMVVFVWRSPLAGPRTLPTSRFRTPVMILLWTLVAGALFTVLRTRTHFLGDGYWLLNSLASENPLLRARNFGEMLVHGWVKDLLPLDPASAALTSFRIVSIGAGMLHVALIVWLGPLLTGQRQSGLWFAAGMMTGGYVLLYFGYVENYSLFGLSVAAFVYVGMLIALGRLQYYWITVPLAGAVFFHGLGLILALPAMYVMAAGSPIATRIAQLKHKNQVVLSFVVAVGLAMVGYLVVSKSQFLAFALVPTNGGAWVVDGYTMLSAAHLADTANLVFLLLPSILLVVAALWGKDQRRLARDARLRFLAVTSLSAFIGVFVFEAKLGMPRDWDLFSFAGYPWMALCLTALFVASPAQQAIRTIQCGVVVALLCLIPRLATAHTPELGIRQFRDYADIDVRKNRSGWFVLRQYYLEVGDSTSAREIADERMQRFPEEDVLYAAERALEEGQVAVSMNLGRQAVRMNPTLALGWTHLARCYVVTDELDSAVSSLLISQALNPDAYESAFLLGLTYYRLGLVDKAENELLKANRLDPREADPYLALARLNHDRGNHGRYVEWLDKAVAQPSSEASWAFELADVHLAQGDLIAAERALQAAMRKGGDGEEVRKRLEAHPELARQMRR